MGAKNKSNKTRKDYKKKAFKKPQVEEKAPKKIKLWIPLLIIVVLTVLVYSNSFHNELIINWDDAGYIVNNEFIKTLDAESVTAIFSEYYMSNYHPLTTLTYAIEYSFVGEDTFLYHVNNLILHLINALLVFFFVRLLFRKGTLWVPFIVSVLFAIHPMHVESVAWISERKDVLYTMFFLLGLISYLKYLRAEKGKYKHFIYLTLFFLLSLFSKSAAVVFPILLFALDWYERRKWSWMIVLEKIPLFALSFVFGIMAMQSQEGAMQDLAPLLTLGERLLIVNFSFLTYIWKLLLPIQLSAMYPYPLKENEVLPQIYFILPIVSAIIVYLIWRLRKNREFIFGFVFFVITIALVIQLLPVGGTIISERYSYLPYIGLLLPLALWLDKIFEKRKNLLPFIIGIPVILFSLQSFNRVSYWENGDILFTDVISKYPKLPYAYNNRGFLYWDYYALKVYKDNTVKKDVYVEKAYKDFSKAISLDPDYVQAWNNRAVLLYNTGKVSEALLDFNMVLVLDSAYTDALIGRANTLSTLELFTESLIDYNKYLQEKPDDARAWVWRAIAHANLKNYDQAFLDLRFSLTIDESDHEAWYWIALCHYQQEVYDSAIVYFDKSILLKDDYSEVYAWKGLALHRLGQYNAAIEVFGKAISYSPNDPTSYVNRAVSFYYLNDFDAALKDLNTAGQMNYPLNREFYMAVQNRNPHFQAK